jgi:uncharacterized protein YozE (UPF0346 family)
MQDDEVLFSTPQEENDSSEQSEVLNSTSELLHSTPEPVKITPELLHSTPNKKENNKASNIDDKKERENSQRDQSPTQQTSPSLSTQRKNDWYVFFDNLYRSKEGYPANFKVPRTKKNDEGIASLIEANATFEQAAFVFNDIWDDPDPFWKKNRTISSVASQFAVRVVKMSKPKTIGGYTIYQPDPNAKDLPFVGTERQRKQREQERKNIPAEHKNVYEGVYTALQQLGATVQEAHDDARVIVEHHRRYGYTIGQEQLDALIDHLMQEVKGLDEPEYVKQNILGNTIIELASKANRKAGNLA